MNPRSADTKSSQFGSDRAESPATKGPGSVKRRTIGRFPGDHRTNRRRATAPRRGEYFSILPLSPAVPGRWRLSPEILTYLLLDYYSGASCTSGAESPAISASSSPGDDGPYRCSHKWQRVGDSGIRLEPLSLGPRVSVLNDPPADDSKAAILHPPSCRPSLRSIAEGPWIYGSVREGLCATRRRIGNFTHLTSPSSVNESNRLLLTRKSASWMP